METPTIQLQDPRHDWMHLVESAHRGRRTDPSVACWSTVGPSAAPQSSTSAAPRSSLTGARQIRRRPETAFRREVFDADQAVERRHLHR